MTNSGYEPSELEIQITLALGKTLLSPYYQGFVHSLNLRGGEKVLDFGSGSGVCSRHIATRLQYGGGWLDCVDISHGWMQVIRQTLKGYPHTGFHLGRITELNLPAGCYDAVVIHFVLHDIPSLERVDTIRSLAGKLKSDGRLLLREPQGQGLTRDELSHLAVSAGLHEQRFAARKIALVGSVYDAEYAR